MQTEKNKITIEFTGFVQSNVITGTFYALLPEENNRIATVHLFKEEDDEEWSAKDLEMGFLIDLEEISHIAPKN